MSARRPLAGWIRSAHAGRQNKCGVHHTLSLPSRRLEKLLEAQFEARLAVPRLAI
jgi:hypothetical protein